MMVEDTQWTLTWGNVFSCFFCAAWFSGRELSVMCADCSHQTSAFLLVALYIKPSAEGLSYTVRPKLSLSALCIQSLPPAPQLSSPVFLQTWETFLKLRAPLCSCRNTGKAEKVYIGQGWNARSCWI